MRVLNVHARTYPVGIAAVARFIDGLGSPEDRLWPRREWPAMVLRNGLEIGARGGHGPIRYTVERFERGRVAVFRFTRPRGWAGTHRFSLEAHPAGGSTPRADETTLGAGESTLGVDEDTPRTGETPPREGESSLSAAESPPTAGGTTLTHTLEMEARGVGLLLWVLVFRPLHDALLEEGLDRVGVELGLQSPDARAGGARKRTPRVRFLRWLLGVRASAEPGTSG